MELGAALQHLGVSAEQVALVAVLLAAFPWFARLIAALGNWVRRDAPLRVEETKQAGENRRADNVLRSHWETRVEARLDQCEEEHRECRKEREDCRADLSEVRNDMHGVRQDYNLVEAALVAMRQQLDRMGGDRIAPGDD